MSSINLCSTLSRRKRSSSHICLLFSYVNVKLQLRSCRPLWVHNVSSLKDPSWFLSTTEISKVCHKTRQFCFLMPIIVIFFFFCVGNAAGCSTAPAQAGAPTHRYLRAPQGLASVKHPYFRNFKYFHEKSLFIWAPQKDTRMKGSQFSSAVRQLKFSIKIFVTCMVHWQNKC